jgi:hypothetical protein
MEVTDLHKEVEALIEAVEPQLKGGLVIVENEDWTASFNRSESFDLQYMLTANNLEHAIQLQTLALKHNDHQKDRVLEVIFSLCRFFDIMQERYLSYFHNSEQRLLNLIQKKKAKESSSETKKSTLSAAEIEMKFQGELTKKYQKLVNLHKKLLTLSDETSLDVQLYGDAKTPFMMASQMEDIFPQIRLHIEKIEKQENKKLRESD